MLQARAVDVGMRVTNGPIKFRHDGAAGDLPLRCGVRLDKYYKKSKDALRREDLNGR
jgi:hypothetical protein